MKKTIFEGMATAMVTPMNAGGIDYEAMGRFIDWQIECGINALVVMGTTGENATIEPEDQTEVIRYTVERVAGRIPVIAGTATNNTEHVLRNPREACRVGADAVLVVTPYYNKATQNGLVKHFYAVADASTVPVIVYNVPTRTSVNILPRTAATLAEHPNIVGIKEASGDMSYAMKIAHCIGPDFALYSGNDDITIPLMSIGGSGVISVYANVMPAMCHQIVADYLGGNQAQAVANHLKYLKLMNDLFIEVNPIPVKTAMNMIGLNVGPMRLPLCEMSEEHQTVLRASLKEAGLL